VSEERSRQETEQAEPPRRHRALGWNVVFAAVTAASAAATFGILQRRSNEAEVSHWTKEQAVPTVAVVAPLPGASVQELVLPGTVQAWYEAPIYARVNGYLGMWYFDYGAHVKKGDVLATIETPELDAQLAAAKSKLEAAKAQVKVREAEKKFAQTTYTRWRESPKGAVSVQEVESKEADYYTGIARLNAAQSDVSADQSYVDNIEALESFKKITAPFDGIVTARETDIGALINAGSGTGGGSGPELFRVADIHKMRVYFQVPQALSAGIHKGLNAELHLPQHPERTFEAAVATTSGAINTAARTLLVELHAGNPEGLLQPGAYAQTVFELPGNPALVQLPTSALIFREHGTEVATLGPDNKALIKPVTLGRNLGTEVEILKGVTLADRVINSPPDSLANGDIVNIAAAPAPNSGKHFMARKARL
jgi:RND family efflux transporter MFP subunit